MASTTATASSWSEIQKQSSNSTPVLTNFLADFISSSKQSSSTICNEKNNIKNCQSANTSEKNVVDKNLHHNGLIPDSVVQLCSTKKPLKQSEDGILSLEQVLNKMKSLEEINKKLSAENKQISDWMDNDSNTIEDLTAQLETAQKKINASEKEQSCLKIKVLELDSVKSYLSTKVGELENVNKNFVEEAKKKMEEEKFHQKKSAEIKAEIEKLDQNITYFNQQEKKGDNLPDKKTTPSLLGCLHKDLEQEKSELEEKLCDLESLNKTEVKLYRESREKVKKLSAQIAKLEKEMLSIELENSSLKQDISQSKQQNTLFQQTNMGIKKEITSLKNQNTTLMQHNVALKNNNSTVQQENSALKKENTSLWQEKTSQAPPTPEVPCSVIFQNSLLAKQNSSLHQQNSFLKQEKTST